jgi:hypothetical protein
MSLYSLISHFTSLLFHIIIIIIIIIIVIIIQKIREHHTRNHDVRELQKTAILGTAHRLRKVLM